VKTPLEFCEALLGAVTPTESALRLRGMLAPLGSDLRDYQIASIYALLIGKDRRKELSAYFTPPPLTAATLNAAAAFLTGKESASILDPACGGGAFLVPLARSLVRAHIKKRTSPEVACRRAIAQLHGVEIDEGLAGLSRRLLATMLKHEFTFSLGRETRGTIRQHDFLTARFHEKFDLVIGNPPYGRVRSRLGPEALDSHAPITEYLDSLEEATASHWTCPQYLAAHLIFVSTVSPVGSLPWRFGSAGAPFCSTGCGWS
jgi:adenine-specific DNA-methyltransferase